MAQEEHLDEDTSSDASSRSLYAVHVDLREDGSDSGGTEAGRQPLCSRNSQLNATQGGVQGGQTSKTPFSAAEFQEMIIHALFQSTASMMGASSGILHHAGEETAGFSFANIEGPSLGSTWNEMAYHKAKRKRDKKPDMMRTSAGEQSDSEENFPIPENATPEQRALRTRRLNRWRAKKARELTSNRKAVKKSPYVIHVDGTSKPRRIHRHQWKAAIRGQCGRLDPSMDNINHHAKNVVDSMWHALEKEWEFEGFAHKAREMFEKSATKFMRNRKMQLKYKCQKNIEGPKPNDVSGTHWAKIKELTKKSMKQESTSTYEGSQSKGKGKISDCIVPKLQAAREEQGSQGQVLRRSPELREHMDDFKASDEEDVDSRIRNLRSELLRLENSNQALREPSNSFQEVAIHVTEKRGNMSNVRRQSEAAKENVPPPVVPYTKESHLFSEIATKTAVDCPQRRLANVDTRRLCSIEEQRGGSSSRGQQESDVNTAEMECGDVISMIAVIRGEEEDVGTGVLMGLGGSKFARKIIPTGWCSVKVSSCTPNGCSEACPFPSGWKDYVKQKTLKEAEGRIIMWPQSLVHM